MNERVSGVLYETLGLHIETRLGVNPGHEHIAIQPPPPRLVVYLSWVWLGVSTRTTRGRHVKQSDESPEPEGEGYGSLLGGRAVWLTVFLGNCSRTFEKSQYLPTTPSVHDVTFLFWSVPFFVRPPLGTGCPTQTSTVGSENTAYSCRCLPPTVPQDLVLVTESLRRSGQWRRKYLTTLHTGLTSSAVRLVPRHP